MNAVDLLSLGFRQPGDCLNTADTNCTVSNMREMNREEQVAREYLVHLGYHYIVHEPDGNQTPDFLVDGRLAVEVRRLNQNELTESGYCGLEVTRIRRRTQIESLLASLGPAKWGTSWFVHYTIKRPLTEWKHLRVPLRHRLEAFRDDPREDKPTSIKEVNA